MTKTGPPRPTELLRDALPTADTASAFVERVGQRLGAGALMQRSTPGKNRRLFVRSGKEGDLVIPWPVMSLSITAPPPEGPPPDSPPIRFEAGESWKGGPASISFGDLHPVPAMVTLHDGPLGLSVEYRWDGRWKCMSQPGERDAFADLSAALSTGAGTSLERLLEYVATLDAGRHGPGRVHLPRPVRGGVEGVWMVGRNAIREAMHTRRAPSGSFWAVADGYEGKALAFGASRAAALEAWRKEVERLRPKPPQPIKPEDIEVPDADAQTPQTWNPDESEDARPFVIMVTGGWEAPPYDPSPAAVPAAVVRVAALPPEPPAHGTWTRWVGDRGGTHLAVRLPTSGGFTLVGQALLRLVDLATLNDTLDLLDAENPALSRGEGLVHHASTPMRVATIYYRCVDLGSGLPIDPRIEQSHISETFHAAGFDASWLTTHLLRVRHLEE